jgi:hypothetical protein
MHLKSTGASMMFESIDTKQFTLYAQQEARLNTAYWLSALITEKSSRFGSTLSEKSEVISFKRQIKLMLKHIRKDVRKQKGTAQDLIKHELDFVAKVSKHSIKTSSKRPLQSLLGMPISGDAELVEEEIAFLRGRSEGAAEETLQMHWYRGTYLLYEALNIKEKSNWLTLDRRTLHEKLRKAVHLYSPKMQEIENHCKVYVSHLDLDPYQAEVLKEQLTEDYTEQFAAGRALTEIVATTISIRSGLFSRLFKDSRNQEMINDVLENLNPIQERLILSCIAQGNTIRRAIDAHVVE